MLPYATEHSHGAKLQLTAALPGNPLPFFEAALRSSIRPPWAASVVAGVGAIDVGHRRTYDVHMIKFEWNRAKAASNLKKHGVSFEEAQSVFYDEFAIQFFDEGGSESEDRFLMLGMSNEARLLLVCHCERHGGGTIRIISARKATGNERKHYTVE